MNWKKLLKTAGSVLLETVEQGMERQSKRQGNSRQTSAKSVRDWDKEWQPLGTLANVSLSHLSHSVGLYRASLNGEVVYIGRAVEYNNGGLRKRLSDYTRASDTGRKHRSGQHMHKHAHELQMDILVTGSDAEAAKLAKKLEPQFVRLYRPKWNKMFNG